MVFITFSILDYAFQGTLGVLDFFDILTGEDRYLYELPQERKYMSLVISGISVFFLILVIPIWLVQVLNFIREKPKLKNESKIVARASSGSIGEVSDTGSMFLRPSSDWNPTSFANQTSFLVPKHFQPEESSCCYKQKNENSIGLSLEKNV